MKRYSYRDIEDFYYEQIPTSEDGEFVKHDEAHALLKEAYEAIVENPYYVASDRGDYIGEYCKHCEEEKGYMHLKDCIVLKAEQWLKENR